MQEHYGSGLPVSLSTIKLGKSYIHALRKAENVTMCLNNSHRVTFGLK